MHSAIEAFTLPGMIEEPGWTVGRVISPKPALGPEFMIFRSFVKLSRLVTRERSEPEKFMKTFMLLAISVKFLAGENLILVNLERCLMAREEYFG